MAIRREIQRARLTQLDHVSGLYISAPLGRPSLDALVSLSHYGCRYIQVSRKYTTFRKHDFEDINILSLDFRTLVFKAKMIVLALKYDSIRADSMVHHSIVAANVIE